MKVYIYHFLINIFRGIRSQSCVLETVSLSSTSGFLGMEGVLVSTHCTHAMNHFIYCTAYRSTTTFCPESSNRDKRHPFVPVGNTNRDKKGCQRHVAGAPFCPGWCYQPGQNVLFFQSSFLFHLYSGFISNILSFQLH